MSNETKLAVILHADVVGSTKLVQEDERLAHQRIRDAFRRLSEITSDHGGRVHEIRGDALVADFDRASDAVTAALIFQANSHSRNEDLGDDMRPTCRIGIALGEVVIADNTVTGAGVVLAQRLEQLAPPGGACISAAIREAVPDRLRFSYDDIGDQLLKGFERRQRAYLVTEAASIVEVHPPTKRDEAQNAPTRRMTIAVLPFENLSSDPEQSYFSDGIADELISALSMHRWFHVISRNSSFAFRNENKKPERIGIELGAQYLVDGSVRRAGGRTRISVALVEAASGQQLWSQRFDREPQDVFALQDEIAASVAGAVGIELQIAEQERITRVAPKELSAWEQHLRGMWHLQRVTPEALVLAGRAFDSAVAQDLGFAPYRAWRGLVAYTAVLTGWSEDIESDKRLVVSCGESACEADPLNSDAHLVLGAGLTLYGRFPAAVEELERAVELNPSAALAHFHLGRALIRCDEPERALEHLDLSISLSPRDPWLFMYELWRARALEELKDYERALEAVERSIRIRSHHHFTYTVKIRLLVALDRMNEARTVVSTVLRLEPNFSVSEFSANRVNTGISSTMLESYVDALTRAGLPA